MIRIPRILSQLVVCGLLVAGLAHAQGAAATGESRSDTKASMGQAEATAGAQVSAEAQADLMKRREAIARKAASVSARSQAKAEAELEASAKTVDDQANKGGTTVASRLAAEFGTTADAMMQEKQTLGTSWGQLMIAHSLAANSTTGVTVEQLLQMRQSGMGWGQIAAGLDLELGSAVSGVKAESRVAQGLARADGKVAAMRGSGARGVGVGLDAAGAAHGGKAGVGVGAGAGLGVKIGH